MTSSGYGNLLLVEKSNGIARFTLNRQEKRNALNSALQAEIRAALADTWDCRVITVTGAEGPAFCAGIDLSEGRERRESGDGERRRSYANAADSWGATCNLFTTHPAVVIASVNGFAIAGGLSIVCAADLAIASERAEFGMTEMGFGSFPALVAPLTAKVVLPKHLAQLVFTVQRINAEKAESWGIVNKVVPHAQLREATEEWAQRIASLDPVAIDWAKKALRMLPQMNWDMAIHYGGLIGSQFRAAGASGGDSLQRFLSGQPGLGQGARGAPAS